MSIEEGVSSWCNEYGGQVDLSRLIMATSPFALVLNSGDGLLSSELTEPTLVPHACGLALSPPVGDVLSIRPSTLIVWTVSSTVPRWMLPDSPHPDVLSGHLWVSLRCSSLEPIAKGIYLARRIFIESNLLHVEHPNLQRIVEWLSSQCDDSSFPAAADVFRAWQGSNGVVH
jgi:hypothetical protein